MATREATGSRRSHRLQVRLDNRLIGGVRERAAQTGQSLSSVVRQLVAAALSFDSEPGPRPDSPAALAALLASELTTLMVAAVLPDGQRRMHELTPQAAAAAQDRLTAFREAEE